jgi:DNA-binding CsgD family transcriptional regulator
VLDSDGEAFHLSGRTFDKLEEDENLKIITSDLQKNEQLQVILNLAEVIIGNWTVNQAEVIYFLLDGKTQQQMADQLNVGQSAINNWIKLAKWKQIEKMNHYIASLVGL